MNGVLARWNELPAEKAEEDILPCCGSRNWARGMAARRPIANETALLSASDQIWTNLAESDWDEAFRTHPRIGESAAGNPGGQAKSLSWSGEEQRKLECAAEHVKLALAAGNRAYEQRFRRIFIVCATGKSAPEILGILRRRLGNQERVELLEAAEQQRQIAQLRLKKWLVS